MLKIFSTQLQGVFKKIEEEKEEFHIEEGARLLSQALVGDGSVYVYGLGELKTVELTAMEGPEKLEGFKPYFVNDEPAHLQPFDRVLILAPYSHDAGAIEAIKSITNQGILTVAVSSILHEGEEGLHQLADVHINSHLTRGLIPDEDGSRFGFPTAMVALYAFHALLFTIKEILAEYDEE